MWWAISSTGKPGHWAAVPGPKLWAGRRHASQRPGERSAPEIKCSGSILGRKTPRYSKISKMRSNAIEIPKCTHSIALYTFGVTHLPHGLAAMDTSNSDRKLFAADLSNLIYGTTGTSNLVRVHIFRDLFVHCIELQIRFWPTDLTMIQKCSRRSHVQGR